MKNLVLVEDDQLFVETINFHFSKEYKIQSFQSAEGYLNHLSSTVKEPDVIVLDYTLPGIPGFELFQKLKPQFKSAHFVVLSSNDDGSLLLEMIQGGLRDYVIKDDEFIQGLNLVLKDDVDSYLEMLK